MRLSSPPKWKWLSAWVNAATRRTKSPDRLEQLRGAVEGLNEHLAGLREEMRSSFRDLQQRVFTLHGPAPMEYGSGLPQAWKQALLGSLAEEPGLGAECDDLLRDLENGNTHARCLLGQILLFSASPRERLPQLLRDLGEAYYAWRPKTHPDNGSSDQALAHWLQQKCREAGIRNTISLVQPGDRFDPSRHEADSPGAEVTEVRGWVVLRDNGGVYAKARVALR